MSDTWGDAGGGDTWGASSSGGQQTAALAARMSLLRDAVPELDGPAAYALASDFSTQSGDMVHAAYGAVSGAVIKQKAAELSQMPTEYQQSVYAGMTPDRQTLYKNYANYVSPGVVQRQEQVDQTWYSSALGKVGGALGAAKDAVVQGGSNVMGWMQNANDFMAQRGPRAAHDMEADERLADIALVMRSARSQMEAQGVTMTDDQWKSYFSNYMTRNKHDYFALGNTTVNPLSGDFWNRGQNYDKFDPWAAHAGPVDDATYSKFEQAAYALEESPDHSSDMRAAWGRTATGEDYIPPSVQIEAQNKLGGRDGEGYQLALYLAKGHTLEEFIHNREGLVATDPKFAGRYQALATTYFGTKDKPNHDWQAAESILAKGTAHVSLGRDFAETLSLNPDSFAHTAISGGADALAALTLDPTLIAGEATKVARAIQWGLKTTEDVQTVRRLATLGTTTEGALSFAKPAPKWMVDAGKLTNGADHLAPFFEDQSLAMRPLFDEAGKATPFLVDNHEAIDAALGHARQDLMTKAADGDGIANDLLGRIDPMHRYIQSADVVNGTSGKGLMDAYRINRAKKQWDAAERIAKAFVDDAADDKTAFDKLFKELPQTQKGITAIQQWDELLRSSVGRGIQDGHDIFDFYQSPTLGFPTLSAGNLTKTAVSQNLIELPRITAASQTWRGGINGVGRAVDWMMAGQDRASQAGTVWGKLPHPIQALGKGIFSATHLMPEADMLRFAGDGDVTSFRKLLDYSAFVPGMTPEMRAGLLSDYIRGVTVKPMAITHDLGEAGLDTLRAASGEADFAERFGGAHLIDSNNNFTPFAHQHLDEVKSWADEIGHPELIDALNGVQVTEGEGGRILSMAGRINTVKGYLDQVFENLGSYDDPKFGSTAREYVTKMTTQRYASDGLDVINAGSQERRAALMPVAQWAGAMEIPNFREIGAQAQRLSYIGRTMGTINNPVIDAFMAKGWKPMTLLRAGFIPRTAGEEMFGFLSRFGLEGIEAKLAANATSEYDNPLIKLAKTVGTLPFTLAGNSPREAMLYREARNAASWRQGMTSAAEKWGFEPNAADAMSYAMNYAAAHATNLVKRFEFSFAGDELRHSALIAGADRGSELQSITREATAKDVAERTATNVGDKITEEVQSNRGYHLAEDPAGLVKAYARATKNAEAAEELGRYAAVQDAFARDVSASHRFLNDDPNGDESLTTILVAKSPAQALSNPKWVRLQHTGRWTELDRSSFQLKDDVPHEILHRMAASYQLMQADPIYLHAIEGLRGALPADQLVSLGRSLKVAPRVDETATKAAETAYQDRLTAHLNSFPEEGGAPMLEHPGAPPSPTMAADPHHDDAIARLNELKTSLAGWSDAERAHLQRVLEGTPWRMEGELPISEKARKFLDITEDDITKGKIKLTPRIERLLRSAAPDDPAEQLILRIARSKQKVEDLDRLLEFPGRIRSAVAGEAPLVAMTEAEMRKTVADRMYRALSDPTVVGHQWHRYVSDHVRAWQDGATGAHVAVPPAEGLTSYYHVMADQPSIDRLAQMKNDPTFIDQLRGNGVTDADLDLVKRMFGTEWNTGLQDMSHGNRALTESGNIRPIGHLSTTDYDSARRISDALSALDHGVTAPTFGVGYRRLSSPGKWPTKAAGERAASPVAHGSSVHTMAPEQIDKVLPYTDSRIVEMNGHMVEGVSQSEALHTWAAQATDHIMGQLTNGGEVLHELVEPLANHRFGLDTLQAIDLRDLPQKFVAPVLYQHDSNWFQKVSKWGFSDVIGPAMDSIVRRPMFVLNFSKGLESAEPLRAMLTSKSTMDQGLNAARPAGINTVQDLRRDWRLIPDWEREGATAETWARYLPENHPLNGLSEARFDAVVRAGAHDEYVQKTITDTALGRAINDTIPYIHDHHVRSFFQDYARNVMPFEFAQEQFLKRWANTFVHSPEAFERAQLLVHGFTHSGVVHKDASGTDVFTFPMTEALNKLIGAPWNPINRLWGGPAQIPTNVPLTGEVKALIPGPSEFGQLPSLGPVGSVPLGGLVSKFPEFAAVTDPISGIKGGNNRSAIEQLVPSYMSNAYKAIVDAPDAQAQLNGATLGAMQQMAAESIRLRSEADEMERAGDTEGAQAKRARAAELSIGPDSDPARIQAYVDNVTHWSRGNMMLRSMIGFFSPTQPHPEFQGAELTQGLTALLQHMPIDQAYPVFLAEHPEATPFTIFHSKTEGGPVPASQGALDWMTEHRGTIEAFPLAAPYLMPQRVTNEPYNQQAFADEVRMGLRTQRSPEEWIRAYAFAAGSAPYFHTRDKVNAKLIELKANNDSTGAAKLRAWWQGQEKTFIAQNPLFADELKNKGGDTTKTQALAQLRLAIDDPSVPDGGSKANIKTLLDNYDEYATLKAQLSADRRASAQQQKRAMDDEMIRWAKAFTDRHPDTAMVWRNLIAPAAKLRDRQTAEELLASASD